MISSTSPRWHERRPFGLCSGGSGSAPLLAIWRHGQRRCSRLCTLAATCNGDYDLSCKIVQFANYMTQRLLAPFHLSANSLHTWCGPHSGTMTTPSAATFCIILPWRYLESWQTRPPETSCALPPQHRERLQLTWCAAGPWTPAACGPTSPLSCNTSMGHQNSSSQSGSRPLAIVCGILIVGSLGRSRSRICSDGGGEVVCC